MKMITYGQKVDCMRDKIEEIFGQIPDPRVINRCDHKLIDILFIAFCTLLSQGEDFEDMVEFGKQRKAWLETVLELPNGIPSHDTFNRVLRIIEPQHLGECLQADGAGLLDHVKDKLISLDGKKIKGASPDSRGNKGLYILSAWVNDNRLCIGQKRIEDKTNEIIAIPQLIDELDVEGATISIDAIGCQVDIAQKIRHSRAHYLLAVKGNQKDLMEEIEEAFQYSSIQHYDENWEYDHGRYERRRCEVLDAKVSLSPNQLERWIDVQQIIKITAQRTIKEKTSTELRYYISSLNQNDAKRFNELVRGHWGIENHLHWHLDVTFNEDANRSRSGNAPVNLNILRKMALQRIKQMKDRLSLKKRRFRAALNLEYLIKILTLV
ncbi:MAG: ISAs1 family transposase [Bacteroidota bacterium]